MKSLRLEQHGNNILVSLAESEIPKEQVEKVAIEIVTKAKDHKMGLPELKQKLERRIPSFNISNYKYSKFSQFIKDLDGMRVKNNTVERKEKS